MTIPNADEDVKQLELSNITSGKAKWHNHFENSLAVPYV